jgi:hypothetical protein
METICVSTERELRIYRPSPIEPRVETALLIERLFLKSKAEG